MFRKIVKMYYHILDDKIKSWAFVVMIVIFLILTIWFLSNEEKTIKHIKTSLIEHKKI